MTNERPDLDRCQLFLWWKGLTGLAFSYVLWYNDPTEVYDEKNFRMTPIHYCMVGLLAFIVLAISSRLLGGTIANLFVILLILSGVIYLFLHQLKQVELDELEQIQYVNHQAEKWVGLATG